MRDIDGWSSDEVCEALEITAGNQRVLLHRARSRLRNALEDYFRDPMRLPRFRKRATRSDELSCKELVRLVTDYLEGALSETDVHRFDAHLAACDGCTTYLAQVRDTIRITGTLTKESLVPEARDELLAAFRTWKHDRD